MTTKPIKPGTTVRHDDRTSRTDDEHVVDMVLLPPPEHLIRFFPIQGTPVEALVAGTRSRIRSILKGTDDRLLVVVGPCSIHDPAAALDYARRLAAERERAADTLEIVMRVYFEKPRTTVGWKGLINDPYLDESCRISEGLRIARQLLIDIGRLGVPSGSELLDTISPQYIGDLIAWGAIGARTTESQVHRELASGSSAPIGFKNGTDGNVKIACDAIQAASRPHHFLGVHKSGQIAMIRTRGNPDCHIILRGGSAPNYDEASVTAACAALGERRPSRDADDRLLARELRQAARAPAGRRARDRAPGRRRQPPRLRRDDREPPPSGRAEVHAGPRRSGEARVRHQHHRSLPRLGADGRRIAEPERSGAPPPQGLTSGAARQPMAAGAPLRTP